MKLQCNHSLYWDTFIIPNDIAAKHGWKNSRLIQATSEGLGSVTASLAYHYGNLQRTEVSWFFHFIVYLECRKHVSTVSRNAFCFCKGSCWRIS